MNSRVLTSPSFNRQAKKLIKKYPSLKQELAALGKQLLVNPYMGTRISEKNYKIRLAVKSKGKGKSGGLRVISYVFEVEIEHLESEENILQPIVALLKIYDKSEQPTILKHELEELIEEIEREIDDEEE